ncbi:ABC transporter substrate-binding protein [Agilicoccus flavus]|uniref:ABC transporter substrate-binding protein n=1 Tax=Agilicoccus flavus TaxID=2775968 RepID=UPI001CF6890A|nr:ABC transporter substrate-binding protein [Agilicoccus flavus]
MRLLRPALFTSALIAAIGLAGCAAPKDQAGGASSAPATSASCTKDSLQTLKPGTLTVGTDKPAYEPWFAKNDPSNGQGYESAVAYALAEKLGYAKNEVAWAVVPFNSAYAPGTKTFDLDLNQVSISDQRKKAVDFSSGYYDVRQTVITTKGSKIAGTTKIADLKPAKLGAQVGTTSLKAIGDVIGASAAPAVFDSNDAAVQALKNKQIDGLVVDLPTAFYMTAAQLDDGVIVGQLPASGGATEQFGAVLAKGSPLTSCVSQAVNGLRTDGTLDRLAKQYLTGAGAPELS